MERFHAMDGKLQPFPCRKKAGNSSPDPRVRRSWVPGSRLTRRRRRVYPAGSPRGFVAIPWVGKRGMTHPKTRRHEDAKKAGSWALKTGFMPTRYDGVLSRSLPPLTCLWIESFRPPCAGIWGERRDAWEAVSGFLEGLDEL